MSDSDSSDYVPLTRFPRAPNYVSGDSIAAPRTLPPPRIFPLPPLTEQDIAILRRQISKPRRALSAETMKREKETLINNIGDLLKTGKYADTKIRCSGHEWDVHSVILSARSTFFAGACNSDFQEHHTGIIEFPEDGPAEIGKMLEFVYTGSYVLDDEEEGRGGTSTTTAEATKPASADLATTAIDIVIDIEAAITKRKARAKKFGPDDTDDEIVQKIKRAKRFGGGAGKNDGEGGKGDGGEGEGKNGEGDLVGRLRRATLHGLIGLLGDKYGVEGLVEFAKGRMEELVRSDGF